MDTTVEKPLGLASVAQANALVEEWTKRSTNFSSSGRSSRESDGGSPVPVSYDNLLERAVTLIETFDIDQVRLRYLWQSIEMGLLPSLRWRIQEWEKFLSASKDEAVRSELAEIKAKAVKMFEVEREYGRGSLLNLDHPIIRDLSVWPSSLIRPSEIEAARRFQGLADRDGD